MVRFCHGTGVTVAPFEPQASLDHLSRIQALAVYVFPLGREICEVKATSVSERG